MAGFAYTGVGLWFAFPGLSAVVHSFFTAGFWTHSILHVAMAIGLLFALAAARQNATPPSNVHYEGSSADWLAAFVRRITTSAGEWHHHNLMPNPEAFASLLRELAESIEESLEEHRHEYEKPQCDQLRRQDTLIVLGELAEILRHPLAASSVCLVPTESDSNRVKHEKETKIRERVLLIESSIRRIFAQVNVREDFLAPRLKISFWRDGPTTKRKAALYQFRFGWDKKSESNFSHVDGVLAHKPRITRKTWLRHINLLAWHNGKSDRTALKFCVRWVRDIRHRVEQLPIYKGILMPHPALKWNRDLQLAA